MKASFCGVAFALASWLFVSLPVSVQAADADGPGDHDLLKRVEGSEIIWSQQMEQGEMAVALDRVEWDYDAQKFKETRMEYAEGRHTILYYKMPEGTSEKQAVKYLQTELLAIGFNTLFSGANDELDDGSNRFVEQLFPTVKQDEQLPYLHQFNHEKQRYAAMKGPGENGQAVYVSMYAFTLQDDAAAGYEKLKERHELASDNVVVRVDVLETKGVDASLIQIKAADVEEALNTQGRAAIYGIFFDPDKAEIRQESTETLGEIAKAIKNTPVGQRFLIVGHTDNQGGNPSRNQTLSSRRATAVVAELVGVYDIPAEKLIPFGAGMSSPLAPNTNEEGRARNRRIEIVAM